MERFNPFTKIKISKTPLAVFDSPIKLGNSMFVRSSFGLPKFSHVS